MRQAEVVVIGAGVAGLAAFQRLRQRGCDAVLVEARGRVGGRVYTEPVSGWPLPLELGAEFVHGHPPELVDVPPEPSPAGGRNWSLVDGKLRPVDEDDVFGFERIVERLQRLAPAAPDHSFAEFLDFFPGLSPAARVRAYSFIEGFEAADPSRISVQSLRREFGREQGESHRPAGGYAALLRYLQLPGPLFLNTMVRSVCWGHGQVVIKAQTADPAGEPISWQARRAIVTLPLSLMRPSAPGGVAIAFDPPLVAKRWAFDHATMGGARRVTLRFREPFWRELRDSEGNRLQDLRFLFGGPVDTAHFPTFWTAPGSGPGAAQLTAWAAGRHAWALAGFTADRLRRRVLDDLSRALSVDRARLEDLLLGIHSHDWESDTFSRGAYSYALVGGLDAAGALAAPLDHTLYFAGEATDDTGEHATVQGALRSGRRAAEEVLAAA